MADQGHSAQSELESARQRIVELEQQLYVLERLLDAVPDIVMFKDPESRMRYANRAFRDYYGISEQAYAELIDPARPAPDQSQPYVQDDRRVFETGEQLDLTAEPFPRFDGTIQYFHTTKSQLRDADETPIGTVSVFQNVTQERAALLALAASEARLSQFMDALPLGIYVLNPDGSVAYANAMLRNVMGGQQAGTGPLRRISDMLPLYRAGTSTPYPQAELPVQVALRGERNEVEDIEIELPHVGRRLLHVVGEPIYDADGSIAYALGVIRDITERRQDEQERARLQEQIIHMQALALAELSTPLIPLSGDVLIMPLIGSIDSHRAAQITEALLQGVAEHKARFAIVDVTGVPIVDTQVASAIVQAARAVRLLGAQIILTGIRPELAQTLIGLGVDLTGVITRSSLQSGVADVLRQLS